MQHEMIVTGFGPFPRVKHNPSAIVARAVGDDRRWARLGRRVKSEVLLVSYARVTERLAELAKEPPRVLLMFGVAARRRAVTPEVFAINRITRSLPDAVKSRPGSRIIEPGGSAFRRSRADVPALVRAVRVAGVPAKLSRSAGRYVCNFALWHGLAAMPLETRVVFIHIPMPQVAGEKRVGRKGAGKPDIAALIRAGRSIALALCRLSLRCRTGQNGARRR